MNVPTLSRLCRARPLAAFGLAALLLAGLLGNGAAPASAEDFVLQGLRGGRLVESDLAQGTTIFVVWASWSPKSRGVVERVNAISNRWGGKARVATVNFQENRQAVEQFLAGKGLSAEVFLDESGAFSKKYSVATLPGLLVVKDGKIVYRGKLPDDPDPVIANLLP
jgi:thiol-disulfide isomerase/thioredoxin